MTANEVHPVANMWAVGDDDHRFSTEDEARNYAAWLTATKADIDGPHLNER